jgi:phosphatidylinositol 4-kinase
MKYGGTDTFPLKMLSRASGLGERKKFDLRNNICQLLDNNAEVYNLVQKLQFTQCIYLLSVFRLETLRYF